MWLMFKLKLIWKTCIEFDQQTNSRMFSFNEPSSCFNFNKTGEYFEQWASFYHCKMEDIFSLKEVWGVCDVLKFNTSIQTPSFYHWPQQIEFSIIFGLKAGYHFQYIHTERLILSRTETFVNVNRISQVTIFVPLSSLRFAFEKYARFFFSKYILDQLERLV